MWRLFAALCLAALAGDAAQHTPSSASQARARASRSSPLAGFGSSPRLPFTPAAGHGLGRAPSAQQLYDALFGLYREQRNAAGAAAVYAGGAAASGHGGTVNDLTPFPVDLPLGTGADATTLPVLVLPLPVLVGLPGRSNECSASGAHASSSSASAQSESFPALDLRKQPFDTRQQAFDTRPQAFDSRPQAFATRPPALALNASYAFDAPPPHMLPLVAVTSDQLVEQFIAQTPTAPHLPPAVIDQLTAPAMLQSPRGFAPPSGIDQRSGASGYLPPAPAPPPGPFVPSNRYAPPPPPRGYLPSEGPTPPRFPRSLQMRATLTVPRADYSEPYTAWFDADSGSARVDFHGGATSTVRTTMPDGRQRRFEMRIDASDGPAVRRCGVAEPAPADASDNRALPMLPDMTHFSFAEYRAEGEVWQKTLNGAEGELGGARGEALTFHHEVVLRRGADGDAVPLRYSVSIDSSVLGTHCDGYEHRYEEVRAQAVDPSVFAADLDRQCDSQERLDTRNAEHMARLEPLREFTMLRRDPRHDDGIQRFIQEFSRNYMDSKEEAVRKNLFVQHSRFINSCNREGATFEVEVNFLGDRLDAELDVLLGSLFEKDLGQGAYFPHSNQELGSLEKTLPEEFDWRPRGAVTPVRYQGSCSSCWAFAVVGSVEGAHFIRTGKLVPLSEQCLVDCAHTHGANGCRGTWPDRAYSYVRERGLPPRDEYPAYSERVMSCRVPPVQPQTHIHGYVDVPPNSVNALKVAIRRHAPTVVVIDAKPKSFMFYKKGVLKDERCLKGPKRKLNHAVLAVGWGVESDFILKNTYSAAWGDGGYIRMDGPSNTCGVLSVPSYAKLRKADVDRPAGGGQAIGDTDPEVDKDSRR